MEISLCCSFSLSLWEKRGGGGGLLLSSSTSTVEPGTDVVGEAVLSPVILDMYVLVGLEIVVCGARYIEGMHVCMYQKSLIAIPLQPAPHLDHFMT